MAETQHILLARNLAPAPLGRLVMAGLIRRSPGIPRGTLRHFGSYALVYSLSGRGEYWDEGGHARQLVPGDAVLVLPDWPHGYGPATDAEADEQPWDEFFLIFDGPLFDLWTSQGMISTDRLIYHLEPLAYWRRRMEAVAAPDGGPLGQVCRLQQLLADVIASAELSSEPDREFVTRAQAMLDAASEVDWPALSGRLGLSYEGFRKRFARLTGVSPAKYRAQRSIDRSCQLLLDPARTLAEIAQTLGFCDEFHFSKRFKQLTGMSPTQFRRRMPQ